MSDHDGHTYSLPADPHPSPVDPAEVREVLAKWLRHTSTCPHMLWLTGGGGIDQDGPRPPCACGLDAALASLSAPVPPEPQLSEQWAALHEWARKCPHLPGCLWHRGGECDCGRNGPLIATEAQAVDWTPVAPYHLAAAASPDDHSIPWNCPTYWDGCNCPPPATTEGEPE